MSIYLKKNRFAKIDAFYNLRLDEFHMETHAHNRCEIMYVTDGNCEVELDGQLFRLNPGYFVFIDQDIPHRLTVGRKNPCSIMNIEFTCADNIQGVDLHYISERADSFREFLEDRQDYKLLFDNQNMAGSLKTLIDMLYNKQNDNSYMVELMFSQILVIMSLCEKGIRKQSGLLYIKKAKEYINENYLYDITSEMIANYAGINRSYLHTLFSRYENCSITTYINTLRLERAVFLLKNTNMKITDIAFSTGFNSRQHFGYTFEKHFNISPLKYRKLVNRPESANTETFVQGTVHDKGKGS